MSRCIGTDTLLLLQCIQRPEPVVDMKLDNIGTLESQLKVEATSNDTTWHSSFNG